MHTYSRTLSRGNVDQILAAYTGSLSSLGESTANLRGLELLKALKRGKARSGPYPDVTLFEAANRIMTDLVILHGVKWLLNHDVFPFESYDVEWGIEDQRGFDIRAEANGVALIGEAFNVAHLLGKKNAMLKKLRDAAEKTDYRILMFNADVVGENYAPKPRANEFFVLVDIYTGRVRMIPDRPGLR